ncbi:MAG: hypothetical protein Q9191_002528 [Dirinaria sp. TL-2023a]
MEEYTAEAFVNRDEPVPVLTIPIEDTPSTASSDTEHASKRTRLRNKLSSSHLKEKLHDASNPHESGTSLQDRLFSKLMQQVIPVQEVGDDGEVRLDERSSKYIQRPSFSLPLMTKNFRRFNARIGVVFVFQTRLIRLLNWTTPSHTLSLLAVLSFICLDPYLLPVLLLASILLFVFVPAFLARHPPPPPAANDSTYSLHGPPLAPPSTIRPASEMSKDFFRNMRDLQNSMDDFSTSHDMLIALVAPFTNFSNEELSSSIFLILFVITCLSFITAHLLPFRFLALAVAWTVIPLGHPNVQRLAILTRKNHLRPHEKTAQSFYNKYITADITLDAPREEREVEIFELQHLHHHEWEPWLYSPSPYDPGNPSRIAGDRARGTRFFEDVQPPEGWEWSGKKWELDLGSRDWVEERIVQKVAVEEDGERWVVDLAEGPEEGEEGTIARVIKGKGPGWEEGTGRERTGIWRRRRWVRMVRRKAVGT